MAKIANNQYIIAIGASAGGLEAISEFFDHTPLDAVSYILIQHLSADFKSQMGNILSPHSKLQVIEVTDDIKIEANKVYLIPSSKFMAIKGNKLLLSDKKDQQRPHMTIDHFFISLAAEKSNKAIGIILSGTGNDGSKGLAAIKAAGGITIVQEPATAKFNEMPLAAIATECADLILSPKAMPRVIEDYVKNGVLEFSTQNKRPAINETELSNIITLIKGHLPLDFTDYKRPTILRRIKRRMEQHNYSDIEQYYDFLKLNPKEIEILANDFLISVTSFFRDPEAFKIIEKIILPDCIAQAKDDVLKIWVAGCATGEEAYTLAILVKEYLTKAKKHLDVKLFATDISKTALSIASKGIYGENIQKTVSKERLEHFFTREGSGYKVKHEIRKMLIFAQHDLVKNPPYCNIDLISCRNLLIYLNVVLQKKVLSMMHFGLKKGGYLFLGPSENTTSLKTDFIEISNKWNILQSNTSGRSIKLDTFSSPITESYKASDLEFSNKSASITKLSFADDMNMAILEESGFSGICIDENLIVVRSFGNTAAYLKNENFNHNLNDLLPDEVSITFKAAVHKALKLHERVVLNGMGFKGTGLPGNRLVNIVIKPFFVGKTADQLLLVLFTENKGKAKDKNIIVHADIKQLTRQHLISLEKELSEAKDNLEIANERIESSNENMQSFNEELQSANEEMQSANEELQSVNEELQTINKEHQVTNAELTESNDDLNNYFRSNTNGQLFVDHELLLKKYSPGAVKHINIRDSDIGRPLSNITTNIKLETLIDDIKQVMLDDETITREAESSDGKIYQVMTMPYIRQKSSKADGAIISFYDITELKKLLRELDISNKSLTDSVASIELSKEKVSQSLEREKGLNILKSRFVSMASHEFKTPLTSIQLSAEIIGRMALEMDHPAIKKYTDTIKSSTKNLTNILNDYLSLELLETGKINPILNEFDVVEFAKEITEDMQLLTKRDQQIIFRYTGTNHMVTLNSSLLKNCIINLISNAIKYSGQGSLIEFTIKITKTHFVIRIKDNGIGIPKNDQKHLFAAFFRAHNTGNIPGTGLGLNIVHRYTDLMNGKIKVKSNIDEGTVFILTFPVK
jgi:two-component system CheB/CheR fusion protein